MLIWLVVFMYECRIVQTSEVKLQEAVKEGDEEIQRCAAELLTLVDSVSKYKEFMEGKVSEMTNAVSETAKAIAEARMVSLPKKISQYFETN